MSSWSTPFSYSICIFLHKAAVSKFPFTHCWSKAETFWATIRTYDIRECRWRMGSRGVNGNFTTREGARAPLVASPFVVPWPLHSWWNFQLLLVANTSLAHFWVLWIGWQNILSIIFSRGIVQKALNSRDIALWHCISKRDIPDYRVSLKRCPTPVQNMAQPLMKRP